MSTTGGIDWVVVQRALQRWVVAGSGLPATSVYWGQQDSPRVAEPAIELRVYSQTNLGQPWLDLETNPLTVATHTATGVDPSLNTVTFVAHGLTTGDGPVRLASTVTMPGNVVAGRDYWVIVVGVDTLKLADNYFDTGGNFVGNPIVPLDITTAGSGVLTLVGNARTRRAGQEINYVARGMERLTLSLECHTSAGVGMAMAMSFLHSVMARRRLPSQQALLKAANIGVETIDRVRAIHGIRNAVMFEPRASLQAYFSVPFEVFETGTIIQRATGTFLLTGDPFVLS